MADVNIAPMAPCTDQLGLCRDTLFDGDVSSAYPIILPGWGGAKLYFPALVEIKRITIINDPSCI